MVMLHCTSVTLAATSTHRRKRSCNHQYSVFFAFPQSKYTSTGKIYGAHSCDTFYEELQLLNICNSGILLKGGHSVGVSGGIILMLY